jgi:hypothetical protein
LVHDLHNRYHGSKLAGAEWAKATLDAFWSSLIDPTWAGWPHPEVSVRQPADPADFQATLEFIRYVIDESAAYVRAHQLE